MKRREIALVEFTLMLGALIFMAALLIPTTLDLCDTILNPYQKSPQSQEQKTTPFVDVATTLHPLTGPVAYLDENTLQVLQ